MKQHEIQKCIKCSQGVMHAGMPLFWKISVERFGIDIKSIKRQVGLEMMLGNSGLARAMGADEEIAKPVMSKVEFVLCESCAIEENCIPLLAETADFNQSKSINAVDLDIVSK